MYTFVYFFRVGLSAGTGLGVSSALVQNSGNDAPNHDVGNNNPPVVPGNQMGPQNAAAHQEQDDIIEDDIESDSDIEQQMEAMNENVANQGDNNNQDVEAANGMPHNIDQNDLGGNMPPQDQDVEDVVAMVEQHQRQQMESDRSKRKDTEKVDGVKESAQCKTSEDSPCACRCSCREEPKAGPSKSSFSLQEDKEQKAATTSLKCECPMERSGCVSNRSNGNSEGGGPDDQDICCSNCGVKYDPSEFESVCDERPRRTSSRTSRSHSNSPEISPTRRSKRLRQSQENCDQPVPSGAGRETNSCGLHNRQGYRGKGKSLRGSKKGLVKRSPTSESAGDVRNQSCQAVSEEIRETTKKAKEKDEAARKEGRATKESAVPDKKDSGQVQSCVRRCPIHSHPNNQPTSAELSPSTSNLGADSQSESVSQSNSNQPPSPVGASSNRTEPEAEEVRSSRTMGTQTGSRSGSRSRDTSRKTSRRKPNMCDQATSTSDPVIEEDHVQVKAYAFVFYPF